MNASKQFELNNEIETLNAEISTIKKIILQQNKNVISELKEFEDKRILLLKVLLIQYAQCSLNANKRSVDFWNNHQVFTA